MKQMEIFPGEVFADTQDFDSHMSLLIPTYPAMLDTLVQLIPPGSIRILELGCGTGALSLKLLQSSPNYQLTAWDYSPRMLRVAHQKILNQGYGDRFHCREVDFGQWAQDPSTISLSHVDACVSSLAIHHLKDEMKLTLFKTIKSILNPGGVFWNADPVLESLPLVGQVYEQVREDWASSQGTSVAAIRAKMGKSSTYGYSSQDQLASLEGNLDLLRQAGFNQVSVPWKYYNLAIMGGVVAE